MAQTMNQHEEITGQKFGYLTVLPGRGVINYDINGKTKRTKHVLTVKCRCDCGNEKMISYYSLINGQAKSCGCKSIELRTANTHRKVNLHEELTGARQGKIVILPERNVVRNKYNKGHLKLYYRCDCGKEGWTYYHTFKNGHMSSCPSCSRSCSSKIGEINRNEAIKRIEAAAGFDAGTIIITGNHKIGQSPNGRHKNLDVVLAEAICKNCGKTFYMPSGDLLGGKYLSCGCMQYSKSNRQYKTYDMGQICYSLAKIYRYTISKCYDDNNTCYMSYGGIGIKVCNEWKNDVDAFIKWAIDHDYHVGLYLCRYDENKDYTPENCFWGEHHPRWSGYKDIIKRGEKSLC